MNSLQRLCSGSLALSTAFWGYLIGGGLALLVAESVIGGVSVMAYPTARVPIYVAGFFILWAFVYRQLRHVAVRQCSQNRIAADRRQGFRDFAGSLVSVHSLEQ